MAYDDRSVRTLIRDVRRQFTLRARRQHLAVCVAVICVLLFVLVWVHPYLTAVLFRSALALAVGLPAVLFWYLHRRSQQLTDEQVALFIEEHHPDLEDRLNSAVQAPDTADPIVVTALLRDATHQVSRMPPRTMIGRLRARLWIAASLAVACICLVGGLTQLDRLQLDTPPELRLRTPYLVVSPGNIEVDQGDTVPVIATLRSDGREDVLLVHQDPAGEWVRQPMIPGNDPGAHLAELADVQQTLQYYVESGRYRTDPFTVSVYLFPEVVQIDATYESPNYANLPVRTQEDEGDIEGLKGSRVTVTVHTNQVTETAALSLENGADIPLSRVEPGKFRGKLDLKDEDRYTVQLTDDRARANRFPRTYLITPIEDARPQITLREPGRDLRANAIQEVLIAADASDDYGIRSLALNYVVNGEEEVSIDLLGGAGGPEVTGEHLLFLEDYPLEPGDVITYYIEAADALHTEASDMYFIEIIPFEQQFTQLANAGGGQGGMQQRQGGLVVSQQDIIAATWRLLREQPPDFEEALEALIQAQRNLQTNIQERLRTTAFSLELRGNLEQQKVAGHLQSAVTEMDGAIRELSAERLHEALTPERRAYHQLLRADALNTERQVARQQQGGGGGTNATEERMSELMDLELDITRDKYESPQSAPAAAASAEQNDALRRVRDLAERQQELARQRPPETEEDRRRFVDRLQRNQEELQESLESLRRQQSGRRAQDDMNQALRSMEDAQRALRRGDAEEAATRQQQAANSLQSLEQSLRVQTRGTDRRALQQLSDDLRTFIEREQALNEDVAEAGDRPTAEELDQLLARRTEVLENLEEILEQAGMLESSNSEAQLAARNLRQEFHRSALPEDLQNSERALRNGWMPTARRIQEEIAEDLEGLNAIQRELSASLPMTEEETLRRSLEDLEQLRSELQDLDTQAERLREGGGSPAQTARLERQMNRAREAARTLQEGLRDGQRATAGIQNSLARADHTGVLLDGESAETFFDRNIYAPLSQLETRLLEALETMELESKLYGSRRGEAPAEYEGLIERYYESLSRRSGQ